MFYLPTASYPNGSRRDLVVLPSQDFAGGTRRRFEGSAPRLPRPGCP